MTYSPFSFASSGDLSASCLIEIDIHPLQTDQADDQPDDQNPTDKQNGLPAAHHFVLRQVNGHPEIMPARDENGED